MYGRLTKRFQNKDEAGFTLIELLIVIVILGILAAIVVFAIGKTRSDSVASACKTNFKSVELSAEAVKTKTGTYPAVTAPAPATNADWKVQATVNAYYLTLIGTDTTVNGALLKNYPVSSDYSLVYATTSTGFSITVRDSAGTAVANPTTSASCDALQ